MKGNILFIIFCMIAPVGLSQQLTGEVQNKDDHSKLNGVAIFWQNNLRTAVVTDAGGSFTINYPDTLPKYLIASGTGFSRDSILVKGKNTNAVTFKLKPTMELEQVNVTEKRGASEYSLIKPINTQVLSGKELQKAACCNVSESFETNASVDLNYTDAVSGAKQIQMLGLDGVYTQILSENVPLIRGLSSSYGLTFVPGTWVESILVTKGAGSVVSGYESMTGQIQIEMIEPEKAEKLFVNGYLNTNSRFELNAHSGTKLNDKLSTALFLHGSTVKGIMDNNNDGFVDNPLSTQLNLMNRWHYSKPGKTEGQFGVKALSEERTSGQLDMKTDHASGNHENPYLVNIGTKQLELFGKRGFLFEDKPYKSFGLISNAKYFQQSSKFGDKLYNGQHNSVYFNSIYQTIISDTRHVFKSGVSFIGDDFKQQFNDSTFNRIEIVPGAYAEYTYNDLEKISMVAGARLDHHNLYGLKFTPRLHLKYSFNLLTSLRLSGGTGFRSSNVFVENASIFASSRNVKVLEDLKAEEARNMGASLTRKFKIFNREGIINLDYYYTNFKNQVIIDLEKQTEVVFYNLKGRSFSHSFQAELDHNIYEGFDIRLAYKKYIVVSTFGGVERAKPYVPRDRALVNLAYVTPLEKWKFDFTVKWFGVSRVPFAKNEDGSFRKVSSDPYFLSLGQVTKSFKYFDVYLGAENIFNFMQPDPIISSDDPYGQNFDASMIWGPVMGRIIYTGFRYSIK